MTLTQANPESEPGLEKWYNDIYPRQFKTKSKGWSLNLQLFGEEPPQKRIERLVAEGKMPKWAVEKAEKMWRTRFSEGIVDPRGINVRITHDDLMHLIVDPHIWRHPERIERIIVNGYAIYQVRNGREELHSSWVEGEKRLLAYAILEPGEFCRIKTLHLVDAKELERKSKKNGRQTNMAKIVDASITTNDWDVVTLWADPPTSNEWEVEGLEDSLATIFWEVDANGKRTGRIVGIEIVGFLEFDAWDSFPDLETLWRIKGKDPKPVHELLKEIQTEVRRSLEQAATVM